MKIPNKRELQQIPSNHLSDIEFKNLTKLYKNHTREPLSFLVNDTTLPSENPLRFRKNLLSEDFSQENQNSQSQNRAKQSSIQFRWRNW